MVFWSLTDLSYECKNHIAQVYTMMFVCILWNVCTMMMKFPNDPYLKTEPMDKQNRGPQVKEFNSSMNTYQKKLHFLHPYDPLDSWIAILFLLGYCYKIGKTKFLINNRNLFLIIMEAGKKIYCLVRTYFWHILYKDTNLSLVMLGMETRV